MLMLVFMLMSVISTPVEVDCDVFSSVGDLNRVFRLEQDLVDILREQKKRLQEGLEVIRGYAAEVEDMYEGCQECLEDAESPEFKEATERIIGNPIYGYKTMKRLVVDFPKVEESLKDMNFKSKLIHISVLSLPANTSMA